MILQYNSNDESLGLYYSWQNTTVELGRTDINVYLLKSAFTNLQHTNKMITAVCGTALHKG